MSAMNKDPTEIEKEDLIAISAAGGHHFKLLLAMIVSGGIVLIVPEQYKIIFIVLSGLLIVLYGISHINMQFFQRCPRCSVCLNMASPVCLGCGLKLHPTSSRGDGSEWL